MAETKEYLVVTHDIVRTTYAVSAESPEQAEELVMNGEANAEFVDEEFYDHDKVISVEVNE